MRTKDFQTVMLGILLMAAMITFSYEKAPTRIVGAAMKTEMVNASPEKVWEYLFVLACKPAGGKIICDWWPSLELYDIEGAGEGSTNKATQKLAGQDIQFQVLVSAFVPNRKYVEEYSIGGAATFTLLPIGSGTKMTCRYDYVFPVPKGVRLSEQAVADEINRNLDFMFKNIKQNVEAK